MANYRIVIAMDTTQGRQGSRVMVNELSAVEKQANKTRAAVSDISKGWAREFIQQAKLDGVKRPIQEAEMSWAGWKSKARDAAETARTGLGGVIDKLRSASLSVDELAKGFAAIYAAKKVQEITDQTINLRNRLSTLGGSADEISDLSDKLFEIAQTTRTEWAPLSEIFVRTSAAVKNLGYSQEQTLDFTESLTKAIKMSGASTQEASNALIQLSQGLSSNTLQGDELKSILEQLPVVADVIAKGFGVSRGELRELGSQGKISARGIIEAFRQAKGDIDSNFGKTIPTLGDQWVKLKNIFMKTIEQLLPALVPLIELLGKAADLIGKIAGPAAKVIGFIGETSSEAANEMGRFIGVVKDLPPSLAQAAAFEKAWSEEVKNGNQWAETMVNTLNEKANTADAVAKSARLMTQGELSWIKAATLGIDLTEHYGEVWVGQAKVYEENHKIMKTIQDDLDGILTRMQQIRSEAGKQMVENSLTTAFKGLFEGSLTGGALRSQKIVELKQELNDLEAAANPAAAKITELAKAQVTLRNAVKDGLISEREANLRIAQLAKTTKDDLAKGGKKAAEEMQRLKDEFTRLYEEANPVIAANNELARTQDTVNKVTALYPELAQAGVDIMTRMREQMATQIEPMASLKASMQEEIELLSMGNKEREREIFLREKQKELTAAGKPPTDSDMTDLKVLFDLQRLARERGDRREALLEDINGPQREYDQNITILAEEYEKGAISLQQFNDAVSEQNQRLTGSLDLWARQRQLIEDAIPPQTEYQLNLEALNQLWPEETRNTLAYVLALEQLQSEFEKPIPMDKYRSFGNQLADMFADLNDSATQLFGVFEHAFNGLQDIVVDFVMNTKTDFAAMFSDFLRLVAQTIVKMLVIRAIMAAMGVGIGGGLGGTAIGPGGLGISWGGAHADGGSYRVGGYGGTDSQPVLFRATPGEILSVQTPSQAREAKASEPSGGDVKIVNQFNDDYIFNLLESKRGERIVMNVIDRRRNAIKGMVG